MPINYCLPIINSDKKDILKIINNNKNEFQYFEIWIDYIENIDTAFIKDLKNLLNEKLIIVLRRQNLEKPQMPLKLKENIINLMHNTNSLLDLDVFDQKDELQLIKSKKLSIKILLSYHNYRETPADSELNNIIDTMKKYNPTILKLATFCTIKNDAIRLLELLLYLKEQQIACIILGMGKEGAITRIFGTLWGNEMIFAPLSTSESSAPGQLTKMQLESIFKEIVD